MAVRIVAIAASKKPLPWRARRSTTTASTGGSADPCGRARPCQASIVTGDPIGVGDRRGSHMPSGEEGGTRTSSANWGDDDDLVCLILPDLDQSSLEEG